MPAETVLRFTPYRPLTLAPSPARCQGHPMGRCRSGPSTVMPALVAGIHDLTTTASEEFVDPA